MKEWELTQTQVAKLLEITPAAVAMWFGRERVSFKSVIQMADLFDHDVIVDLKPRH